MSENKSSQHLVTMSENRSSQEKTLKQNKKIENHINNHEIPKNEVENQKGSHEESLKENEEIQKINNLQEQFEDEVVESDQMLMSNTEENDESNDYEADAEEEDSDDDDDEEEEEEEEEEYVKINLSNIKDLYCPFCKGIIKKTKTIKECLHRFCRKCIDDYVINGNKECPICFTLFPDQGSLLDDKDYDAIIAAIYLGIEKVKKETPIVEESNKGPRMVAHESGAGEEPIAVEKPIVEKSDDDTASTQQSNKDRATKKSKTS